MSLLGRILRGAGVQPQAASGGAAVVEPLFGGLLEARTEAGQRVTPERALTLPAVLRAIRMTSEVAGALPLHTFRLNRDGERERDDDHPAARLLLEEPNGDLSAVEFWTMVFAHLQGWGRAFIGKQRDGAGRVVELWPIEPRTVTVERLPGGALLFHEAPGDASRPVRTWDQSEVIYIRLFTLNGVDGLSPIGIVRESLGVPMAMRDHVARFYRDYGIPTGALTVPDEISDPDVKERLRQEWKARQQGKRDIAVLDAGAKFEGVTVPLADAQFVELWGASRADIADLFNVPPSLLGAKTGDSMTYGNRESDMRQFLTFTLHNPLRKVEQALTRDRDLFPRAADQRRRHFCEWCREDLLSPDSKARAEFYRHALDPRWGWMDRSEVRRMENLPPEDGPRAPSDPEEPHQQSADTPPAAAAAMNGGTKR